MTIICKDSILHETEETRHNSLLFLELLLDLLHHIVFCALIVFLVFLGLLLRLSLSLDHVCLVLVFLHLVLNDPLLYLFVCLPAGLLLSDAVVADHINEHYTSMNDLLFLFKEQLDVLPELVTTCFTVGMHNVCQGDN